MIKQYEIIAIDNVVCLPGAGVFRAAVRTDRDLSDIIPLINAEAAGARFMAGLCWIRFPFRGFPVEGTTVRQVAVSGKDILVAKFNTREEAADTIRELVAYLNDIDARRKTITPSYREWQPPKVLDICRHLPMTNCRKCAQPTCMAFAALLAEYKEDIAHCPELDPKSVQYEALEKMFNR